MSYRIACIAIRIVSDDSFIVPALDSTEHEMYPAHKCNHLLNSRINTSESFKEQSIFFIILGFMLA